MCDMRAEGTGREGKKRVGRERIEHQMKGVELREEYDQQHGRPERD